MAGAWLGRCAGCALGLPLENGPFMEGLNGAPGWLNVRRWFEGADAWPISGYCPQSSRAEAAFGLSLRNGADRHLSVRERISFMQTDDDIRYTVLGLELLRRRGANWDAWDLGKFWHEMLPYRSVCTAETQAYLNFAEETFHRETERPADWESRLAKVRTRRNPYREWIGAAIRADPFGYCAAGDPETAAEFAYRDGSFSHVKNGIYAEMFVAACVAAAFGLDDPEEVVEVGLSAIPRDCRLAVNLRTAIGIARTAKDIPELVEGIHAAFSSYGCVHSLNNLPLVAGALVFSRGDFGTGIAAAVSGGWDTDCNGASVGSILGALVGAEGIDLRWKAPLHDTLYSGIPDYHPVAISACAARCLEVRRSLGIG
jgi:ADP-ribosylglycohydrolase